MTPSDRLAALAGTLQHTASVPSVQVPHTHTGLARYAASFGDGLLTTIVITHNLGSLDVAIQVYENSTGLPVVPLTMTRTNANVITLTFTLAPTSNQYRILVIG